MTFELQNGATVPKLLDGRPVRWSEKKAKFVDAYIETGEGSESARRAGYAPRSAKATAWRLLNCDPGVMAEVKRRQAELRERNQVTVDDMLDRLDQDREFAFKTENASAAVRASELRAKLAGLLIERRDVRALGNLTIELVSFEGEA